MCAAKLIWRGSNELALALLGLLHAGCFIRPHPVQVTGHCASSDDVAQRHNARR